MKLVTSRLWVASSITIGCLATLTPVRAQIVPDNTLPVNSQVTPGCTVCRIDGGTVQGTNLFQSFQSFSVPTGGEAYFNNSSQIQNIFTRVTGNSVSTIDGLLRANGTANLFFLNPNGMIFGQNATLNLGGSFITSTASSLVFADGTVFSAKPDTSTPALLTISVPIGLQFGANPGGIVVQGNGQGLRNFNSPVIDPNLGWGVKPNQTLALIGGDVSLEGATLQTAGGRIELGSVAGPGLVSLTPISKGWALGYQGVSTLGDIQMQQAAVNATGEGGGDIQIWGRRVTVAGLSWVAADTLGSQPGGKVVVNGTESVEVTGETPDGQFQSNISTVVLGSGKGGDIVINTPTLALRDGGAIGAFPFLSQGKGGDVTINTDTLVLQSGGEIAAITFGQGDAGNLTVNASKGVQVIGINPYVPFVSGLFVSVQPDATGKGGNLTINTPTLLVRDGGVVTAGTLGLGNGGNLTINASQGVQVIGSSIDGQFLSRLTAQAYPGASGRGGDITINTPTLLVQDGAQVSVRSVQGQAGNMNINAPSILLNRGSLLASTAQSGAQAGANITLSGLDLLRLDNESLISANALNNANGGNVTIDSTFIVATPPTGSNGSDITANASKGNGGAINITTQGIYGIQFRPQLTRKNDITVSSDFGIVGQVNVNQLQVDPTQGLAKLPETLTDPSNQIVASCAAAQGNSFIVTGRGGLPEDPTATIRGETVWLDFRDFSQETGVEQFSPQNPQALIGKPSPHLVEANSWVKGPNDEVILIATDPTVTPYGIWQPVVNCPKVSPADAQN